MLAGSYKKIYAIFLVVKISQLIMFEQIPHTPTRVHVMSYYHKFVNACTPST